MSISAWVREGFAGPEKIFFIPTERCNLACEMCCYGVHKERSVMREREIAAERLLELARESAHLGVKRWSIAGGEPFLRKNMLVELFKKLHAAGVISDITTNAVLLDEATLEEILESGLTELNLSLDGSNRKVNDAQRGEGVFDQVISAARLFAAIKNKRQSGAPLLQILTALSRLNMADLPAIADLAADLRADSWFIQPLFLSSDRFESLKPPVGDATLLASLHAAYERAKPRRLVTNLHFFIDVPANRLLGGALLRAEERLRAKKTTSPASAADSPCPPPNIKILESPCLLPYHQIVIHADGTASPCLMMKGDESTSVAEKSLEEVWRSDLFRNLRQSLAQGSPLPICASCCLSGAVESRDLRLAALRELGMHEKLRVEAESALARCPSDMRLTSYRLLAMLKLRGLDLAQELKRLEDEAGADPDFAWVKFVFGCAR
jgi:MoaA/NifB/PqqE/SkfB family radical SAM enzyme